MDFLYVVCVIQPLYIKTSLISFSGRAGPSIAQKLILLLESRTSTGHPEKKAAEPEELFRHIGAGD
jgi:hypothetical protein